jgi:hypothetical protein
MQSAHTHASRLANGYISVHSRMCKKNRVLVCPKQSHSSGRAICLIYIHISYIHMHEGRCTSSDTCNQACDAPVEALISQHDCPLRRCLCRCCWCWCRCRCRCCWSLRPLAHYPPHYVHAPPHADRHRHYSLLPSHSCAPWPQRAMGAFDVHPNSKAAAVCYFCRVQ